MHNSHHLNWMQSKIEHNEFVWFQFLHSSRLSYHHAGKRRWQSTNAKDLPTAAEIVIAGGGITGSSVAYHLAKLGKRDVVVLEQGRFVRIALKYL